MTVTLKAVGAPHEATMRNIVSSPTHSFNGSPV